MMWEGKCCKSMCQILMQVGGKGKFTLTEGLGPQKNNLCPTQMLSNYSLQHHNGGGCALSTTGLLSTVTQGWMGSQGSATYVALSETLKSEDLVQQFLYLLTS